MSSDSPVERLCDRLGYHFSRPDLLTEALTHTSHLNELPDPTRRNSERLEFLGDAVLDLVISDLLLARFPEAPEGELSKLKARLVSEAALSSVASGLDLGAALAGRDPAASDYRLIPVDPPDIAAVAARADRFVIF